MARYIGMTNDEFEEQLIQLPEYAYLLYDVAMQTLYQVPPVPPVIVQALEAPVPNQEVV